MNDKSEEPHFLQPAEHATSVPLGAFDDPLLVQVPSSDLADPSEIQDGLSGRERVAVWFAAALLGMIAIICGTLLWEHHVQMPQVAGAAEQKTAVDNYKALTALIDERTEKFFDLFVTKALLPIFTTLIGFILGRRTKES